MAYSFGSNGALPSSPAPFTSGSSPLLGPSSPYGKALAAASNTPNMSTNTGPKYAPPPAVNTSVAPPPAQPIKKQTVTDSSGNTHVTEYHAPTSGLIQPATSASTVASTQSPTYAEGGHAIIPGGGISAPAQQNNTQPLTGNTTTPSGAVVNASTGQTVSTPQSTTQPSQNTNAGIISGLTNFDPLKNPTVSAAYQKAQDINAQIAQSKKDEANAVAQNDLNPIPIGDQTGREAVLRNQYLAQQNALASEFQGQTGLFQGGLTGTGQQESALSQAGSLSTPSNQFMQVPYSNQVIGADGKVVTSGGSAGALPQQAQDFVSSLAQQVKSGAMTRSDAESRLTAYSQPGLQALDSALGTGFNTNASNASAGTTATGQQIQTAADSTNKALDTLATSFGSLSGLQTGGIPLTNSIAQWIGSNLGDAALTQYKTNLADARSQLIGVLNSSGGTPTGNEATANEYLPDNMTPAQFQQNVGTAQNPGIVRQLVQQKVSSFTNSGQQGGSSTGNSSLFSW